MVTQKEFDELNQMMRWRTVDPHQASRIGHYYHTYINSSFNFCATCPTNVSFAYGALKDWFLSNKDSLQKVIAEVELINIKSNEPELRSDSDSGQTKNKRTKRSKR